MCGDVEEVGIANSAAPETGVEPRALRVATVPGWRSAEAFRNGAVGFVSYGAVSPGDKVLIAATEEFDRAVIEGVSQALRKRGAKAVDVIMVDEGLGPDRELREDDELLVDIRIGSWAANPRRFDYNPKVVAFAKANGYDFLLHSRLFRPPVEFKNEPFPFMTQEELLSDAVVYPAELNYLINKKTWDMIYRQGRGGKVLLTDPEGTDLEYTLNEKYYTSERIDSGLGRPLFGPKPLVGHLHGHPTLPIIEEDDTSGTIAGTTSHFTRPFPNMRLQMDQGRVEAVKGGGGYGKAWGDLLEKTREVKYPEFPRKGLFWLWEGAIGTNPHVRRLSNVMRTHGESFFWEAYRSGAMHLGMGTCWYGLSEQWAEKQGVPYGHLHVHLLFPTYRIKAKGGREIVVIDNGRLTALDDPEVREAAKKYGDPEVLLKEAWIPKIPGITMGGSYDDYGRDPASWIHEHG